MTNPLELPSTNFNRVRDGRNAPDFWFDIDLTAAGDISLDMAGNSFYVDANPIDGVAVAYFQDTNLDRTPTPFYISPGFIARIPFVKMRFTWAAQPGKKIRIIFGTDTDFQPGSIAQVTLSSSVTGSVVALPQANTLDAENTTALASGANVNLVLPAANINGLILYSVCGQQQSTQFGNHEYIIAHNAAPTAVTDGQTVAQSQAIQWSGSFNGAYYFPIQVQEIPAGLGLYALNFNGIQSSGNRQIRYRLK